MKKHIIIIFTLLLSNLAFAIDFNENAEIKKIFTKDSIDGTIVIYDAENKTYTGYNKERGEKQFPPASTFKIANTIIGLETKKVKSTDEIFFKDESGKEMSLRSAIKISHVPTYQKLARNIGEKEMKKNIVKMHYGNMEIGSVVDRFWLDGPLQISAIEQTVFLEKLAKNNLPYKKETLESVKDIIKLEEGKNYTLYGKTGYTDTVSPTVGWFVGFVMKGEKIYTFALNMNMEGKEFSKRIEITKEALKKLGII